MKKPTPEQMLAAVTKLQDISTIIVEYLVVKEKLTPSEVNGVLALIHVTIWKNTSGAEDLDTELMDYKQRFKSTSDFVDSADQFVLIDNGHRHDA